MYKHKRTHWKVVLGAGVGYVLVVGLMTLPASLHLSDRLIGNNIDNWGFYWNNWWLEQVINDGYDWSFTPYLFYPQGASLVAHSISALSSLLALPIRPLVGPVAAYNLVFLFGLWLSALGMFLLVCEYTDRPSAALLAGFVFAFAPYHMTQLLAHAHLGSIHWWPFYLLFLRRALYAHQVVDILCTGLFAALTLWSGRQLAVLLAMWTILYIAWFLLQEAGSHTDRKHSPFRIVGTASLVGIVTLLLSAPMVLPVMENWTQLAEGAATFSEGGILQTDLLAYFVPPTYHPLAGPHVVSFYQRFEANRVAMPYLGYIALGLALASLWLQKREARFWLLSTGFWMVLAAGSIPRLNGSLYPHIPLPYRIVAQVFPISAIRSPDRFNLLVVFSLAVAVGLGAAYLARRRRWLLVPLAILVIAEYLCIPLPAWDIPLASPFFEQMAQEEPKYGVVDYPMGYTVSKLWLYYQTLHGKPLVEGHVSRYILDNYSFIASQPLLQAFYQTAEKPPHIAQETLDGEASSTLALGPALRSLDTSGVRYILLHKPYLDPDLQTHFQRILPVAPTYEDSTLAVYDTAHPLSTYYDGFPILLTSDVALARFDVRHDELNAEWRFGIVVTPLSSPVSPHTCHIQLTGKEGHISTSPITFFERPRNGGTWQAGDPDVKEVVTVIPQHLETGTYHWTLTCPEAAVYTSPDTLQVHIDGHTTYLRRSTDLRYGEAIGFLGYRWWTIGSDLYVALWWKALEPPPTDYKVFVHLLNVNNKVVRQYDAMPCYWECPTSQWQTGEIVSDQAVIPLSGLPPEEYRLAVGLWNTETLERLPVQRPDGTSYPDAYFVLPDTFSISGGQQPVAVELQ